MVGPPATYCVCVFSSQSCSSALSDGVKSMDGYLNDGIKGQSLSANPVTREMASHLDMQNFKGKEVLPRKNATGHYISRPKFAVAEKRLLPTDAYAALLEQHGRIVEKGRRSPRC